MPVLISNPEKFFWHINEVYIGPSSGPTQVYQVKVDDLVLNWNTGLWKVQSMNLDGSPVLVRWDPSEFANPVDIDGGIITGLSGYQPSVINKAFYRNPSGSDRYIRIDSRYKVYGTGTLICKLFKGTDISSNGIVITTDSFITPTQDYATMTSLGGGIYIPPELLITTVLADGDTVTLVVYNNGGGRLSYTHFIVKMASGILPLNASNKFIQQITLNSSWVDIGDPDLIKVPLGHSFPTDLSTMDATVTFTDNTTKVVSIDGIDCSLLGVSSFNNALLGNINYITLLYNPAPLEVTQNGNMNAQVTRTYKVIVDDSSPISGYKVYLSIGYNEVQDIFTITPYLTHVTYGEPYKLEVGQYSILKLNGESLNMDRSYNVGAPAEDINIKVYLNEVYPNLFPNINTVFTQVIRLDLSDVSSYNSTWKLDYNLADTDVLDGIYKAVTLASDDYEKVSITGGSNSQSIWLDRLYDKIVPIFIGSVPTPTHFKVKYIHDNNVEFVSSEISIANWANKIDSLGNFQWKNNTTIDIYWLKTNPGNPKDVLGITPMFIAASPF